MTNPLIHERGRAECWRRIADIFVGPLAIKLRSGLPFVVWIYSAALINDSGIFSNYRGESEHSQRIVHAGHLGNQLPNLSDAVSLM